MNLMVKRERKESFHRSLLQACLECEVQPDQQEQGMYVVLYPLFECFFSLTVVSLHFKFNIIQ